MSKITVVIPCYNEAQRLPLDLFLEHTRAHADHRFLFVDDGSRDETWSVLKTLCAESPEQLQCCQLETNRGKAEAVRRGMLAALEGESEFVGYWDADLATPLESISRFHDVMTVREHVNIVMGSRVQLLGHSINRSRARHYIGRLFATLASLVLKLPVYDTQCGAKLFRCGDYVREIFAKPFLTSWVFDVELLGRYSNLVGTLQAKETIREYPLEIWCDIPGSKLRWHHGFRAGWELTVIRRNHPPTQVGLPAKVESDLQDDPVLSGNASR